MSTKRLTTAGLPPDVATAILEILRNVGFIADRQAICELYRISPRRLGYFLMTTQAEEAASQATDLTRFEFYKELCVRSGLFVDASNPDTTPLEPSTQWDATIVELTPHNGMSSRDARTIRKLSDAKRRQESTAAYLKKVGSEMTPEEIAKWDRLAETE